MLMLTPPRYPAAWPCRGRNGPPTAAPPRRAVLPCSPLRCLEGVPAPPVRPGRGPARPPPAVGAAQLPSLAVATALARVRGKAGERPLLLPLFQ